MAKGKCIEQFSGETNRNNEHMGGGDNIKVNRLWTAFNGLIR
jgi:hypothetical protein